MCIRDRAKRIKQGLWQAIAVAVGYGIVAGLVMIIFGRPLSMIFVKKSAVDVLDASAKYLRCMGCFYWSLGILNVARMVTQGLGYSGRAIFSGVTEMLARIIVSLGFAGTFGFTAICFADQTAWVTATIYILPTCLYLSLIHIFEDIYKTQYATHRLCHDGCYSRTGAVPFEDNYTEQVKEYVEYCRERQKHERRSAVSQRPEHT